MVKFKKKAQALTELAIFGSILLMLLGILLHYGMKYNFQQQAMQEAFRRALGVVATSTASTQKDNLSASYLVVRDRHVPDPLDPFGMGPIVSVSSQASVSRNFKTHESASDKNGLPKIFIDINNQNFSAGGEERNFLYTAAFRDIKNVPVEELVDDYDCDGNGIVEEDEGSKYSCIYGSKDIGWWELEEGQCLCEKVTKKNPQTGENEEVCPEGYATKNIRVIDDCAGEIVSMEAVNKRCNQIKDANIDEPWYCDPVDKQSLFSFSVVEEPAMGLQPSFIQNTTANNKLSKKESSSGIFTENNLNWKVSTYRGIVYNDNLDDKGFSKDVAHVGGVKPVGKVDVKTLETIANIACRGDESCKEQVLMTGILSDVCQNGSCTTQTRESTTNW